MLTLTFIEVLFHKKIHPYIQSFSCFTHILNCDSGLSAKNHHSDFYSDGKNELHVYRFHWVVFCLFSVILFRPLSQAVPLMHLTSKRFCNLARVSRRVWSTLHCSTEYLISLNCLIWYWTYYFVNWSLTVLKCPFSHAFLKRYEMSCEQSELST